MTGWPDPAPSYDRVAKAYEARFVDELASKPRDRELLVSFAATTEDGIVVDLGCGPGQIGQFVASLGANVVVAGLDRSAAMARLATARLGGGAVVGDLRALPFGDRRLAGVTAFYCLIHLPRTDVPIAVAEIARVLRPGGRALLTAHACRAAGLDVEVAERRPPYATEGPTVRLTVLAVKR